jgi:hemerythrin-like domain-containing protein
MRIIFLFYCLSVLSVCSAQEPHQEEVSPTEDLMREHGVLNRILLIYEELVARLSTGRPFPSEVLLQAATIIRTFIEEYHEHLEEHYLFPYFEKAGKFTRLIQILTRQHNAGRTLTKSILSIAHKRKLSPTDKKNLKKYICSFIRMYRPHEAREDTVLFPELRSLISKSEYDKLGELFEQKEQEFFGEDGFKKIVELVSELERELGIYELTQFTPKL